MKNLENIKETDMETSDRLFLNIYDHCETVWDDEGDCCCNDRCPVCGKEIEPEFSKELE